MKFGDKLLELRKKNGLSQEELAEKLGVSRQSVSKWESNQTYPETDKIIQVANLFDCSMDDLINDKITDVESTLRKNKNNLNDIWNSLLEFITDSVNMFSNMSFKDGIKCVGEMIIISFILLILGHIICNSTADVISNIFRFLSVENRSMLRETLKSIFHLIWFIISFIAIIHTFKIKYLNYYDSNSKEETKETNKDNNIKKEEKIVTKQEKEKPLEFLNVFAKIVILFLKFISLWILLGTIFACIGLLIGTVISLSFVSTNLLFLWLGLLLLSVATVTILIIILIISFIAEKKVNVMANIIIFVGCIILSGISVGMLTLSIKNIDFIRDNSELKIETKEINLEYEDNLVIESNGLGLSNSYKYIIDNNMPDKLITVSREIDNRYFKLYTTKTEIDKLPVIRVTESGVDDFNSFYNLYINNLKENKFLTFEDYANDPLIIKANESTVLNLINNFKKIYLTEEEDNENEINIIEHHDKVYFINGLEGEYDAKDDSIKYYDENYSCKKEIESTKYGEKFTYICNYKEEE